ncbi:MAG: ATP-grasp domain-containing protein [Candidatus Babeliaceae bacterium]|jgi:D-alanine-D-alanine ligase
MKKLRIGVLMGGRSIEREVSLNSGRTICDHLDTAQYESIPLFQTRDNVLYILPQRFVHRGKIADFEHRLASEAQEISWDTLKNYVDIIYIAQHGRFAEDGKLQGTLEILQIPYIGSKVFASALGMDKDIQKKFLTADGIRVPNSITIQPHDIPYYQENLDILKKNILEKNLTLPLVIKPVHEGSSLGVSIVRSWDALIAAITTAAYIFEDQPQHVLLEEFIEGMEFSCIIITNYITKNLIALPPTEIVPEKHSFFDYEQKYMPGKACKHTPARCTEESIEHIKNTCIQVMRTLQFSNIARIDGFLTHDGSIVITDPNSFCGMDPASFAFLQAAQINMSHTQFINHLITTELYSYGMIKESETLQREDQTTMLNKKRIGIICGGRSNEKEISLESGRNVAYKLSPQKYDPVPLFLNSNLELYKLDQKLLVLNTTREIENLLTPEAKIAWSELANHIDFAFIALHGGEGENGSIQGMLEMLQIPYNGSGVLTSSLCMNKFTTNRFLKQKGFCVPDGVLVEKDTKIPLLPAFPVIVKPHDDGCSMLVHKAHTHEELVNALETIYASGKNYALIEECVIGMELTVGVIGNNKPQALPPSQAVASKGILSIEEKFLPGAGENQTPALLPQGTLELVKKTMEQVYTELNCKGYVRIDCFYQTQEQSPTGHERVIILEINTLPGLTPATVLFHQAAELNIKPMDFIDMLIELGSEEHGKNRQCVAENTHVQQY